MIKYLYIAISLVLLIGCKKDEIIISEIGKAFELRYSQSSEIQSEDIIIKLTDVNDSRCPKGVQCIWEGKADVTLDVSVKQENIQFGLSTYVKSSIDTLGYKFTLLEVSPYPDVTKEVKLKDYFVLLEVLISE